VCVCVFAGVLVYGCAAGFHIFHLSHALEDSVILKRKKKNSVSLSR